MKEMRVIPSPRSKPIQRVLLVCLALAALALPACGEDDDGGGGGGGGSTPITIGIGVDSVFAPMFVAETEGLFEDAGLDVTVRQYAQSGEGVDAVMAGDIQMAAVTETTLLAKATQEPMQGLGVYVEDAGNYTKLAMREGVTSPQQIKTMGVVAGSIHEWGAIKFLEENGIDPESVKFVPVGPPELPALLQRGDIDAFVSPEPWPSNAEKEANAKLSPSSEFGLSYVLVITARSDWVESNREEAKKFMDVLAKAADQVEQDPQAAAEATEQQSKVPAELTERAIDELEFGVRGFDDEDRSNFQALGEFLLDRNLVKEDPPVDEVLKGDVVSQK
jgi:ABC-type nitrate/sulfonate/bicarbonate transport system substrate-binding protein